MGRRQEECYIKKCSKPRKKCPVRRLQYAMLCLSMCVPCIRIVCWKSAVGMGGCTDRYISTVMKKDIFGIDLPGYLLAKISTHIRRPPGSLRVPTRCPLFVRHLPTLPISLRSRASCLSRERLKRDDSNCCWWRPCNSGFPRYCTIRSAWIAKLGFSPSGSASEKLRHGRWLDAAISIYDSRIRLQKTIIKGGQ